MRHAAVGLLGFLAVALSIVLALRRRRARAACTRGGAQEDAGRRALRAVASIGVDASAGAPVRFHLCLPDRAAAERAAVSAAAAPVMTRCIELGPGGLGSTWLCLVTFDMTPTETAMVEASARMVAIAGEHGGELDGWEVAIPW